MATYRPRNLRIGAMRHRITISQPVEEQDEYGQPIVTWENYLTNEPAEWLPTGGTESMRGRQLEANVKGIFRVRYRSGYSTTMKITHNGQDYGILYAEPVDGGRRFMELFVAGSGAL